MNPKLRFKKADGTNFCDWDKCCVLDVFDVVKDRQQKDRRLLTIKQGVGTVPRDESGIDIFATQKSINNYKPVEKGDFVIHLRSFQAGFEVANSNGIVSAAYTMLRNKQPIDVGFFKNYFRLPSFINKSLKFAVEGIRDGKTVNISLLKDVWISVPSIEEQQKIAEFFTALDEKIACEAKRVEKIKLVKKSCLQKIFGEEMHFNDSTPWVETSFGEVSTFVNGRAYAQNELLSRGKYLVLRVGNFFTNSEYYYSDLELDEDKYANDGDLLYAWSASFGPRIWNDGKVIYHYHIWKVVPKNVDKNFLFYALQYDVDGIKGQLNGGTMSHLTKSGIEERVIKIPCDNEQKEIGEFLKLLDQKIVIASRKLEVLVRQKKSFIQRMFI